MRTRVGLVVVVVLVLLLGVVVMVRGSVPLVNPGFESDFEGWWCGDAWWCSKNEVGSGYVGKGWYRLGQVGGWDYGALCQRVELNGYGEFEIGAWCKRGGVGDMYLRSWLVGEGGVVVYDSGPAPPLWCGADWSRRVMTGTLWASGAYTMCLGGRGTFGWGWVDEVELEWKGLGTPTPTATPTPTRVPTPTPPGLVACEGVELLSAARWLGADELLDLYPVTVPVTGYARVTLWWVAGDPEPYREWSAWVYERNPEVGEGQVSGRLHWGMGGGQFYVPDREFDFGRGWGLVVFNNSSYDVGYWVRSVCVLSGGVVPTLTPRPTLVRPTLTPRATVTRLATLTPVVTLTPLPPDFTPDMGTPVVKPTVVVPVTLEPVIDECYSVDRGVPGIEGRVQYTVCLDIDRVEIGAPWGWVDDAIAVGFIGLVGLALLFVLRR